MRKFFAILMAVTLAISAAALPGFAEETGESTDQISSATQAKGGNSNSRRQKPDNSRTPGRNNQMPEQGSQAPDQSSQMPEQGSQAPDPSSQMPEQGSQAPDPSSQTPGQGSQAPDPSSQTPGQGSQAPGQSNRKAQSGQPARPGKNGRGANRGNQSSDPVQSRKSITGMLVDPARLLDAGIITREIYDAIVSYMNEHASQQAEGNAAPAESVPPVPDESMPAEGSSPGREAEAMEQLLKDLLESGAITQAQYDLFLAMIPQSQPDAEGESSI